MATGTVKWFNKTKGFGFIVPDEGEKDIFVHITAVLESGLQELNEGLKATEITAIEQTRFSQLMQIIDNTSRMIPAEVSPGYF